MTLNLKLVAVNMEIVLILTQDRCTICAKCTICLEFVLDAPDERLGDMGPVKSHFGTFGDSVSVSAR
jgi:hypothetical protein